IGSSSVAIFGDRSDRVRSGGRPGRAGQGGSGHGSRRQAVRVVVVGGGSWGTAFSRLLADRGHDVVLACRDPAQARAIGETGRNPRYLKGASLAGVGAAPLADAPFDGAELVVVALPSR